LSEKSVPGFIPVMQVILILVVLVIEHGMLDIVTVISFESSTGKLLPSIVTDVPPFDEP